MSSGFSLDFKEQVRSQTNLVDLVAESVSLVPQRGGRDYLGLCPFHEDHNPSFHVYPDRQSWRCWVCADGGDCFSFVMKKDGLDFREALEFLARRANIELPRERTFHSKEQRQNRLGLYDLLNWAADEFHTCLLESREGQQAREYLRNRGLSDEMISTFRLGFHPNDWTWILRKGSGTYSREQMLEAKLIGISDRTGKDFDYFVNRVLFPICDERGRVVAFGGRSLPGLAEPNSAKYWNSPESPLFSKSKILYGFDLAKDAVRRSERLIVTEGYTDCIVAHQSGFPETVCTLGTALTEQHVALLKRFTRNVTLVYDGDDAGRMASLRSLSKFLSQDLDLRILTLPKQFDPADFLLQEGSDRFRKLLDSAPDAWDFKLQSSLQRIGMDSIDSRHHILDEMLTLIHEVPRLSGTARETMILAKLAQQLGIPERVVRTRQTELQHTSGSSRHSENMEYSVDESGISFRTFWSDGAKVPSKNDRLECELLEIMLTIPEHITTIRQHIGSEDFYNPYLRTIWNVCIDLYEDERVPDYETVISRVEDSVLKNLLTLIDEQSQQKGLYALLTQPTEQEQQEPLQEQQEQQHQADQAATTSPDLLAEVISQFQLRREHLQHKARQHAFIQEQQNQVQSSSHIPTSEIVPSNQSEVINSTFPPSDPPSEDDLLESESQLNPTTLEMLKRATQFHQLRATRKPLQ